MESLAIFLVVMAPIAMGAVIYIVYNYLERMRKQRDEPLLDNSYTNFIAYSAENLAYK